MILVALGSNLPMGGEGPMRVLNRAVDLLRGQGVRVTARSHWYRTRALPPGVQPDYVNGMIACEAAGDAAGFLKLLQRIEGEVGRHRQRRMEPRPADLDLIDFHGQCGSWGPDLAFGRRALVLPHPHIAERAFVLAPLMEITLSLAAAGTWRHPVSGLTAAEMWAALPVSERRGVVRDFGVE